jgi:hypothetical protein
MHRPRSLNVGQKPRYVVRIDDGYYASAHAWKAVERALATELYHREARAVRGKLKRLGYAATVEPACGGPCATPATDGHP